MLKSHSLLYHYLVWFFLPIGFVLVLMVLYFRQSLPDRSGELILPGIQEPVSIVRDSMGVPHIYASTDQDAFFAMGYVHAQDRLWQMEMFRRIGSGRLSELVGEQGIQSDRYMRTLGLYRSSKKDWEYLSAKSRQSLNSYTAGVNAWLQTDPVLPLEFWMLRCQPEQWNVYDSLVAIKLFSWVMAHNNREELDRSRISLQIGKERQQELFGREPAGSQLVLDHLDSLKDAFHWLSDHQKTVARFYPRSGYAAGSNAWAVSGKHTVNGAPLLVSDPHVDNSIPGFWYVAEIKGENIHVTGATCPGLPVVVMGHNQNIAWGATNLMADTQDLYIEKINPDNQNQYQWQGEWLDIEVFEEEIAVKPHFPSFLREPNDPIKWKSRWTKHGPLLNDGPAQADFTLALRWSALKEKDTTYQALFNLNYAQNWNEFRDAVSDFGSLSFYLVYADKLGNIGGQAVGKIPIRKNGDGTNPVPGWKKEFEWESWIPFNELPLVFNPPSGIVSAANHKLVGDSYPYLITRDWSWPYRGKRIEALLQQEINKGQTIEPRDMVTIQADQLSLQTFEILPYLLSFRPKTKEEVQAVSYLQQWDGAFTKESIAATIFEAWTQKFSEKLIEDDLQNNILNLHRSNLLERFTRSEHPHFLKTVLATNDASWCDNIKTDVKENCAALLRITLNEAMRDLRKYKGGDMSDWRWGDVHTLFYPHATFRETRFLESFFNREVKSGGNAYTINIAPSRFDREDGFRSYYGVSYRQIIDVGNWNNSLYSLSTGQSGNALSSHYDDFLAKQTNMEYAPLTFANQTPTDSVFILSPQQ